MNSRRIGILAGSLFCLQASVCSVCAAQQDPLPGSVEPNSTATGLGTGSASPYPQRRLPLDRVVATVNKQVILLSQLQPEYRARVAGAENAERRILSYDERNAIMMRLQLEKVDKARRAEQAKTLGDHTPREIEAWLERRRRAAHEERVRKWGSLNKLYTELNRFGTSSWALEAQERTRLLEELAFFEAIRHIGDQQSLLATPREMHKLWKKVRAKRLRPPATLVSMVTFGPGTGPEGAGLAAKLAAEWARTDADAGEMAGRFGGTALPDQQVAAGGKDGAAPWIQEFATGAPEGKVSAPIVRQDGSLWVLKAIQKDPGDDYSFSDPAVQRELRRQIQSRKMYELRLRQQRRSPALVTYSKSFRPAELR